MLWGFSGTVIPDPAIVQNFDNDHVDRKKKTKKKTHMPRIEKQTFSSGKKMARVFS